MKSINSLCRRGCHGKYSRAEAALQARNASVSLPSDRPRLSNHALLVDVQSSSFYGATTQFCSQFSRHYGSSRANHHIWTMLSKPLHLRWSSTMSNASDHELVNDEDDVLVIVEDPPPLSLDKSAPKEEKNEKAKKSFKRKKRLSRKEIEEREAIVAEFQSGQLSPQQRMRAKRYERYIEEIWSDFSRKEKRSKEEMKNLFEDLARQGVSHTRLKRIVGNIRKRIKKASDDADPLSEEVGPLTLVLPTYRDNLPESEAETRQVLDFLFKTSSEGDSENEHENATIDSLLETLEDDPDRLCNIRDLAEMLHTARYRSMYVSPLFFSQFNETKLEERRKAFQSKSVDDHRQESLKLAFEIYKRLPKNASLWVKDVFQEYLRASKPLVPALEGTDVKDYGSPTGTDRDESDLRIATRRLNKPLYLATFPRFHDIAMDVAHFFDCTSSPSSEGEKEAVMNDIYVAHSLAEWNKTLESLVAQLINFQERIHKAAARLEVDLLEDKDIANEAFLDAAASVPEKETPTVPRNAGTRTHHFRLDAHVPDEHMHEISAPPPFMILVENLPIDATEDEMESWYGRCGAIKSIQIRNRRPDLDPGPLKPTEIQAKRKQRWKEKRFRTVSNRPRSPVYALVEFEDQEGYDQATQDTLCVFGMVLRRHDSRSIPSFQLKSLYVENIAGNFGVEGKEPEQQISAAMIEEQLQTDLSPIWASLSSGQKLNGLAGSCEINFESFDVAWYAYGKLLASGNYNQIHWLRSPKDSYDYWTRERGFE